MAEAVAGTLARMAVGAMPAGALRAYLAARLAGIAKANGGLRVLGCGGVIRRMVAKAVAKVFNKDLRQAAGPSSLV